MILDKRFFKGKPKKKAASSRTKINFRIKLFKPNKGLTIKPASDGYPSCDVVYCHVVLLCIKCQR